MGFVSKYYERDVALPKKLKALQEAIHQDLNNDPHIDAYFYGGSLANKNTDHYSDLDLRIVVKEDVYENFRLNKKERAKRWGDVLYYEGYPNATHSVAHFREFIKVDTFYYKPNDLQPSVYLKKAMIVIDHYGIVTDIVEKSQAIHYTLSIEEFEIWRGKYFAHMHEVYRRVMREELYYALSSLDKMRCSIAMGWDMEKDRTPNFLGDWSKYEGKRSHLATWQLALLESWDCNRDPQEIFKVFKAVNSEFKRVHNVLCEKLGIREKIAWVEDIIQLVE
ncbi:aminoglycoside 6-adenylyltransferase [Bacillus sp. NEB1478]|uniref:aminoglycoside 6-adenylyltransferase n=1 Tax=Bacillus sp. NEB1478 TaxID=3073816 RepID=UPI002872D05A|nr:aminoglycoside 6-adenylyltransferase [Bacillus sp. NEB1478]WNB93853.1 aminoglycoside 6-adenylyltransferase [Bacillus sp. NEB1478]